MINKPIGIFDSGVGGFSIYLNLKKILKKESFIYLADQKNCPYGDKSKKEIKNLSLQGIKFLLSKDCKLIVIACNTATVNSIDYLRQKYPKTLFIGVVPVIKPASKLSKTGHIAILSTKATKKSLYLNQLIKKFAKGKFVYNLSCPGLVELIEKGELKNNKINLLLKKCLAPALKDKRIDVAATGCTHYSFVKKQILNLLPKKTKFIEPGSAVARQVKKILSEKNLLADKKLNDVFYTTKNTKSFEKIFKKLIGLKISVKHVKL